MIIVDTSVWIEFLRQKNEVIERHLEKEIEAGSIVALSPVFGELLQGAGSAREEKIILDLWEDLIKINEDQLFILAGKLSNEYKLNSRGVGLIDCSILVAAKINKFEIWSLDKKLAEAGKLLGITNPIGS
jgi:predicted nucleic acid-binding protein